ncbi:MAG: hypothetical protein ISS91_04875, partial [Candidatus Omnitrophica bacterium]|nr:hypothetical protein [Candidatus Omnitrophota bacterium]
MRLYKLHQKNGMTIPEVLISVMLGMIILSMVLSMWYYAYKNWTLDRIRTNLKVNLEIAIER